MTKFRNLKNLSLFCLGHFCISVNVVMHHYIALSRNMYILQTKKMRTQRFPCENAKNSSHIYIHRSMLRRCEIRIKSQYTGLLCLRTNSKELSTRVAHFGKIRKVHKSNKLT